MVSSDFSKTSPDYSNALNSGMVSHITNFQQQSIFETYKPSPFIYDDMGLSGKENL